MKKISNPMQYFESKCLITTCLIAGIGDFWFQMISIIKQIRLGIIIVLILATSPLFAAVADDINIIGFSKEGRYFAYETFGVQDGSGTPFASIIILDTVKNEMVEGTPINSTFEGGDYGRALRALSEIRPKAAPLLAKLGIKFLYRELASVAAGQKVDDPYKMQFKRYHNIPTLWTVVLTEIDIKGDQERCAYYHKAKGFALSVGQGDQKIKEVYRDDIYHGRGCPVKYKLAKVIVFNDLYEPNNVNNAVILIHVYAPGFEGNEVGFHPVAIKLPDLER